MATMNDNGTGGVKTPDSEPDFTHMRDAIEYRHGVYFMVCSILFFQIINWIIKSQGPPKSLRDDEWKWRNLYVSWIHALIVSIWTSLSLILYPELCQSLLQHINYFTYFDVCFATAYFMYDFLDLLVNNKVLKMWELTLHHFAVIGMFYYNVHIRANIGFNIVALCVEINSFFLHWRKLLQMVGTSYQSRKYIIVKYLNLTSFFVFRFGACVAITTAIFFWRKKVSPTYYMCICVSMVFMNILNVILFSRLFKSDVLRGRPDSRNGSACLNVRKDCQAINGYEPVSTDEFSHQTSHSSKKNGNKKSD